MTGTKLLMTFPVTATSHKLAEYRARGGYGALEKALTQMQPQEVTREVAASGLQGRGGAAFPAGRKFAVIKLDDGQRTICARTQTRATGHVQGPLGPPGDAPHLLLESMLITSYAIGAPQLRLHRGEFIFPTAVSPKVEEAYQAGYFGTVLG
jgi:NADH-quinone oxidoreductase subunit F